MPQTLKAIYHSGTFVLQVDCDLPEGAEVELIVQSDSVTPPKIADISARQNFLKLLVEKMQQNPIPFNAPSFTRDTLHERPWHKHFNLC
jgi:predicted DNA-binding antitoxin AbrB/MazE fold protein